MDNYIIDPIWFYWLQICDTFRVFIIMSGVILSGISIFCALFSVYCTLVSLEDLSGEYKIRSKKWERKAITHIVVGVICVFIGVFIPSKRTLIEMELAKHTTYENINIIVESIENYTDHIIDKLNND